MVDEDLVCTAIRTDDKEGMICTAIRTHKMVRIECEDDLLCYFVIEPYTLGYNELGHLILKGWLRAVGSDPTNCAGAGLRYYLLEAIIGLEILEQAFDHPQQGYVPLGGGEFQSIICDLVYH